MSQIAQINMVKQQLRTDGVLNQSILELFDSIPRHEFVPTAYQAFAYSDMTIPLMHHQQMLTPSQEGQLLQALALEGHETVLEVGTGSGFLTALLSQLSKKVISIDYYPEFIESAQLKLNHYHCTNVELLVGDGCRGWLDKAPYDVIVFTGAIESLTETQRLQISPGGKLFAIVGKAPVMFGQLHQLNHNGEWDIQELFQTNTPFLIDKLKPKQFTF